MWEVGKKKIRKGEDMIEVTVKADTRRTVIIDKYAVDMENTVPIKITIKDNGKIEFDSTVEGKTFRIYGMGVKI